MLNSMGSSAGTPPPGAYWPTSSPDTEIGAFQLHTQERPAPTSTPPDPKKLSSRAAGGYPRRRAVRACQVCRARRTKCDNKKPACSFCERVGAKCITNPIDHSSFDPASLAILERLDRIETLLNRPKPSDDSREGPVEKASPASHSGSISTLSPNLTLSRITIESILTWSPFKGKYESRTNLKALLETSIYRPPEIMSSNEPYPQRLNLDLSACIRLLHNFLERVHIANPILNTTTVLDYLHQVCLRGLRWDAPSCLVLLICSLGSISESFQETHGNSSMVARMSSSFRTAQDYFEAAQMRLGVLQHSHGVLEAQCFFYSGVYLMTIFQPMRAWRSFVQAAAISQSFDFSWTPWERDPDIDDSLRNERASVESTYWASLKSELELRMELGLPSFSLQDVTYPSFFPSPPTEQLDDTGSRVWYFYLAEISVRRLSLRILRYFFENQTDGAFPHIHQMVDSTVEFENQAAKWVASLPPILSLDTPESEDDVLKFVLRGHLLDCYESIYFPFMHEVINNQRRDMGVVEEFARKGLQMSVDRIHKNRAGFKHRHHGVWLMLRSCTRSALVLLAARCCPEMEDLLPLGWAEAVTSVIEMLFYWQEEAGDAGDRQKILMELMNVAQGPM